MPELAACPTCSRKMRLPDGSAGKRLRCKGCESSLRIEEGPDGGLRLATAGASPAAPSRAPAPPPPAEPRARAGGRGRVVRARTRSRARKSGVWLLVIAVLLALSSTVEGLQSLRERAAVEHRLSGLDDGETVSLENGGSMTVAELRTEARVMPVLVFGAGFALAALMVALYFWSRRSPLPAYLTGLGVYLTLVLLAAVGDPSTLWRGILWKVLIVGGLTAGILATLRARADEAEAEPA